MSGGQSETPASGVTELTVREAFARLSETEAEPAPLLVDVRETWEYDDGHARGAISLPLSTFRERFVELPRDRDLLFICHLGQRSMVAAKFMRKQGVMDVFNVEGGTDAWEAAQLPIERGPA
jgi:rhodanese-related sulfurtransferase